MKNKQILSQEIFIYKDLEKKFKVIYPESDNATYYSQLNYSDDLLKPMQRWYRYKEGFSVDLVKQLIQEYNKNPSGVILDPFLGSGSTISAANQMGLNGLGFEVNPFSYFLSRCKLRTYSHEISLEFEIFYLKILEDAKVNKDYILPKLSIANKVFCKEVEQYYMSIKVSIENCKYQHKETKELLMIGWLACLETLSNYRKAGNGLKRKKYAKPRVITSQDVFDKLSEQYSNMLKDIRANTIKYSAKIINDTCVEMNKYIENDSISGIVFSPPYANCFDYTEIYKFELWFGEFVKEYSDLKKLRKTSIRSHLNGDLTRSDNYLTTKSLQFLLKKLESKELWDKKIPKMLELYYSDMFNIINNCYGVLEYKGFCAIVVGNSSYGDVIFPADLLLADYAQSMGFSVDKIVVDRYIITSSQQYESTKENKEFLRESVVCLVKE